jgi:peroxiredoxin
MSVPPTPRPKPSSGSAVEAEILPDPAARHSGLAIASLVLGILGILLSILLIGGLLALVGIILGGIDLARRNARKAVAGWGLGLSIAGLLITILMGFGYLYAYRTAQGFITGLADMDFSGLDTEQWTGVVAPDFTVTTLDGDSITLGDLQGKRVIVDFWATWCGPCVMEIPHFVQLANEVSSDELIVIGITNEDPEEVAPFIKKHGVNYTIASADLDDSPYSEITSIPTTFFIDRNGLIQNILVGYHDFDDLKEYATAPDYDGPPRLAPAVSDAQIDSDTGDYE